MALLSNDDFRFIHSRLGNGDLPRLVTADKPITQPQPATDELKSDINDCLKGSPFSVEIQDERLLVLADGECDKNDVVHLKQVLVEKYKRCLIVNTGTHGTADGQISVYTEDQHYADVEQFIKDDVRTVFTSDKVAVHIISKFSPPIYPEKFDIVDAWCNSRLSIQKRLDQFQKTVEGKENYH